MRSLIMVVGIPLALGAAEPRVLFLGDSITYDGRWATGVESALRRVPAYAGAEIANVGLPSETSSGLSEPGHAGGQFPRPCVHERLGRVLAAFRPTLVIACYGMNDGLMLPPDAARMAAYEQGMTRLRDGIVKTGARVVFLTPPLFRVDRPESDTAGYDGVLDAFAAWLVGRRAAGWEVIDVRPALRQSVAAAKARDGGFVYAPDGIHPDDAGHRFFAAAACAGLWPLLELPGEPRIAGGGEFARLKRAHDVLKLAWLGETKFQRPGIPGGLPVEEARAKAAALRAGEE